MFNVFMPLKMLQRGTRFLGVMGVLCYIWTAGSKVTLCQSSNQRLPIKLVHRLHLKILGLPQAGIFLEWIPLWAIIEECLAFIQTWLEKTDIWSLQQAGNFLEESMSVDNNSESAKTFLEALDLHDETMTQNILYYSKATWKTEHGMKPAAGRIFF